LTSHLQFDTSHPPVIPEQKRGQYVEARLSHRGCQSWETLPTCLLFPHTYIALHNWRVPFAFKSDGT